MANCCNGTDAWNILCLSVNTSVLFGVVTAMLVITLAFNVFCCVSRCRSGKRTCQLRIKRRQTPRQMEENPIYGNISYTQTSPAVFTEANSEDLPLGSSSLRDRHRVSSSSQTRTQECYANLTLKPPRPQSGRSSPQIQYSDVAQLEAPLVSEKVNEDNTDAVSTMSDLYASVQTQRTKTVDTADTGEDYANHL